MSLEVESLSRDYGTQRAVNSLTFSAGKGEIVGFLGPNGAGKSTTMKMLTGYLTPSSGTAKVAGFNIWTQAMEVRKNVGYLPENNPLYTDMYVREYLRFVARIHGLRGKSATSRVNHLIERTGLLPESRKKIGALSKGYRQRVGLAQALLHDPKVLILDEPTSGLDPNQLVDIRALIKELGKEKTVLLSTHIMQEVVALCDRVIIINAGKLVANGPVSTLGEGARGVKVRVRFKDAPSLDSLNAIAGVNDVQVENEDYIITSNTNHDALGDALFAFAVKANNPIRELRKEGASLDQIFSSLTSTTKE